MAQYELTRRGALSALGVSSFALLGGCDWFGSKPTVGNISIRQEWFPYSGFAGEMLAVQEAQKFGVNLRVSAGGETIDPVKMVLARQDDIGVASGDILMKAVADGAPLVAIGVVNDTSPTCFVTKQASGITRPQDFAHKRVGVLKGTNTERIYRLMLRRNNIDPKTITEVDAPFDLNTFILGQYDVRPAFAYDEPVTLAASKIAINMIRPLDYGVKSIGTVYFTRRELLEQREADLVGTLAALITGWRAAATPDGQQKSIDALKKAFPEIDAKRELESLRLAIPYFEGPAGSGRPLTVSQDHLNDTLAGLLELGEVKAGFKVEQFWTDKLLNKAYERLKV